MNNKELEIEIIKNNDKILYDFLNVYNDIINKISGINIKTLIDYYVEVLTNNLINLKFDILKINKMQGGNQN